VNDVVIEVPGLSPEIAAQLADGRLTDPFSTLGPHDTGSGRIIRAFLPGAHEVEVVARSDGHRIGCASPGLMRCRRQKTRTRSRSCC
jgi:1,4-alpha-glucan branching enzyme